MAPGQTEAAPVGDDGRSWLRGGFGLVCIGRNRVSSVLLVVRSRTLGSSGQILGSSRCGFSAPAAE
jgi:hypothetical protein